jgi:phosphatidylserine/phosphatidylglycerophosphate/cardiolipin synthase-like enzyme
MERSRLIGRREVISIFVIVQSLLLLLLPSCAKKRSPQEWVRPEVQTKADTTLVCKDPAESGCAVGTPFEELYRKISETSKGEIPHYVNLLNIGDEALLIRIHLIRAARKSIFIQQFIWIGDEAGNYIFDELVRAARRGVEVRIIGDQLFTSGVAKDMAGAVAAHENIEIKLYNPTYENLETSHMELAKAGVTNLSGVNQRMHSKLLLVDEKIGIVGGRNHQNMYFDRDPDYNFKDRDIFVIGPTVQNMVESFHEYWNYEFSVYAQYLNDVGEHLEAGDYPPSIVSEEIDPIFRDLDRNASDYQYIRKLFVETAYRVEGHVEFFADAPGKPEEGDEGAVWSTLAGIDSVVREATFSLVAQTPYLFFTKEALSDLKKMHQKLPELKILASTNSLASTDHFFTYAAYMKQKQRMLRELGFQIFEFKPVPGDIRKLNPRYEQLKGERLTRKVKPGQQLPVEVERPIMGIHAKVFVVDERIAFVGSHNFDPRSETYDTQVAVAIWDKEVARALQKDILRDMESQNSWVVAPKKQTPVISPCLNLCASFSRSLPIFDIWPSRYSSLYELREDMEPIPPDHPEFYVHYENVGQFPEVALTSTQVHTILYTTMAGFTTPLL